jgi:hypothetical protein
LLHRFSLFLKTPYLLRLTVFVNSFIGATQNNTPLEIPSQGILKIEFDDGTTEEINLDRVKGISIQPVGN